MMTARILRMISKKGFTELFFEEMGANPNDKYCDIFDRLNEEYKTATGVLRYSCYKSFSVVNISRAKR